MAFSKFEVSCHVVVVPAEGGNQSLLSIPKWSESILAAGGVSSLAAPNGQRPVFHFRAPADGYVAFGTSPNAAASPRMPVAANVDYDIVGQPNDKIAWSPAS